MSFLEYVIRPYEAPTPHGTTIIPSTPSGTRERATLTWGAKATMPPVNTGFNFNLQCCSEKLDEQSRDSDTIRIMGTDGKSYVVVHRPHTVRLNKNETNKCGDNWDQVSGVAARVNDMLAEWDAAFADIDSPSQACGATWTLKNEPQ